MLQIIVTKAISYHEGKAELDSQFTTIVSIDRLPENRGKLVKWPTGSRKDEYYINEEGMYELAFTSQQKENFIFVMIMKMIFGNYISKK